MHCQKGFTLTELIMVIVILGIVSTISVQFIRFSTQTAIDTSTRQQVAVAGMNILEPISRDLRGALPESIRRPPGTDNCLEFLPIEVAGRYEALPQDTNEPDLLRTVGEPSASQDEDPFGYVVIYPYADNPHNSGTVRTVEQHDWSGESIDVSDDPSGDALFSSGSPTRRFFLVSGPVAYCHDAGNDLIQRYTDYGFNNTPASGSSGVVGAGVSEFDTGIEGPSLTRNAVVTMEIELMPLREGAAGDTHTLAREVQIRNVP